MNSKLKNPQLEIEVKQQGAELCSIKDCGSGIQWLWTGNSAYWPRHAPVLFPVVGKLKNNEYIYDDKKYFLPQHGFARDRMHELIETTETTLKFKLTADEQSLSIFPRHFELYTEYILLGNEIITRWTVRNKGEKDMHFSIGGHPAFLCPLDHDDKLADYHIQFEVEENPVRWLLKDGLITGNTSYGNVKDIALSEELFEADAVIFSELKSQFVNLKSSQRKEYIQFDFGKMPYLAFWKKQQAPFVCIEPWHGLADLTNHNHKLEEKHGVEKLRPEESFTCQYSIIIKSE